MHEISSMISEMLFPHINPRVPSASVQNLSVYHEEHHCPWQEASPSFFILKKMMNMFPSPTVALNVLAPVTYIINN